MEIPHRQVIHPLIRGTKIMNEQIDQTALNLSRSIRKAEGGDYENRTGDAGTSAGAYQFNNGKIPLKKGEIPSNFKSWAQEEGLDPNDFSQTNQDHVVYSRIKKKLDARQAPSSIAAEWNSGLAKGWENHKGSTIINGKKIDYDTPAYVDKVKNEYNRLNSESPQQVESTLPGIGSLPKPAIQNNLGMQEEDPNTPKDPYTGTLGTKPEDSTYGKIIDNSVTRDLINLVPGSKQLGTEIGKSLAWGKEKISGLFGGQDNSKYIPQTDVGNALGGGAKLMATGAAIGAGALGANALLSATAISETGPVTTKIASILKMDPGRVATILRLYKGGLITKAIAKTMGPEAQKVVEFLTHVGLE